MRTSIATQSYQLTAMALALATFSTGAMATNGYFSHGYGMKAKGMGGASMALSQDAFSGANNPASAAFSGNRIEAGLDLFMPSRGMERTGGFAPASVDSQQNQFIVPELAFNRVINDRLAVGLTVYGNGGMNTDYPGGQIPANGCGPGAPAANVICGVGNLGVNLQQLVVAPNVAYKLSDNHSVGVSPLLVFQQFKAYGLQAFQQPGFSANSAALTNNGNDSSKGVGLRLGYMGKLNDKVSVGASYSPKTKMSKLDKYAGLFAGGGSFDLPENYALGVAFQATPSVLLAVDYQHIGYSGIPSIANPSTNQAQLGSSSGPGFGWTDVKVWKLGAQWQVSPKLALRAGYNKGSNPVQGRDVTFNILAPGVTTTHFTLGGTYTLASGAEITATFMQAPKNSVSGSTFLPFGGTEKISMSQRSLGVQMGWKF